MVNVKLNTIVDILMVIAAICLIITLIIGVRNMHSLHEFAGYSLIVLIALHFVLHAKQLFAMIKNLFAK